MLLKNFFKVIKSFVWIFWIILGSAIIALPSYYFIEKDLIVWNLWYHFYLLELILTIFIAIFFWLFIWSTLYKVKFFQIKKSWLWFFWWFIWVLVSWCPACSITFASYLWLWTIVSILPFYGIELKILSLVILFYVIYSTLKTLEICSIKK